MHQKTIDALVAHNEDASNLLNSIAEWGKQLAWQCREPVDPTAEYVEMRWKTADLRGLMSMLEEVESFVEGTAVVDADLIDAAFEKESDDSARAAIDMLNDD